MAKTRKAKHPEEHTRTLRSMNPKEPSLELQFRYDRGSAYEEGTFTTRVLEIISNEESLFCHDERIFQLLHLQTEISWYNIHFELRGAIRALNERNYDYAQRMIARAGLLSDFPNLALQTMLSSISQSSFLSFRGALPENATGISSPGMINLRSVSKLLWNAFESQLQTHGFTSLSFAKARMQTPGSSNETSVIAGIFDAIQQFDIKIMMWKQLHLRLVWTYLGGVSTEPDSSSIEEISEAKRTEKSANMPTSLRGRPISDLQRMTARPLFPKLWQISAHAYEVMNEPVSSKGVT